MRSIAFVTTIALFTIVSVQQRNYIEEFETPPVQRCYHYDEYGNYIHGSRLSYTCPTPTIIEKSNQRLKLSFVYTFVGMPSGHYSSGGRVEDGYVYVEIDISYFENGIIKEYDYKEAVNYIQLDYDRTEEGKFVLSEELKISSYGYMNMKTTQEENTITQIKKVYEYPELVGTFEELDEIEFPEVDEEFLLTHEVDKIEYDITDYSLLYTIVSNYPDRENNPEYFSYYGASFNSGRNFSIGKPDESINPNIEGARTILSVCQLSDKQYYCDNEYLSSRTSIYYQKLDEYNLKVVTALDKFQWDGVTNSGSYDAWNKTEQQENKIYKYNDFYVLKTKFYVYNVSKTEYGYIIEEYGEDGYKSGDTPPGDSFELEHSFMGIDYYVISMVNPSNFVYTSIIPTMYVNPAIKLLLENYK